jgi:hypothetical protein
MHLFPGVSSIEAWMKGTKDVHAAEKPARGEKKRGNHNLNSNL